MRNLLTRLAVAALVALLVDGCGASGPSNPSIASSGAPNPGDPSSTSSPPSTSTTTGTALPPAPVKPRGKPVPTMADEARLWHRFHISDMPSQWASRDGAQMVQLATGRILMVGGWSANDPWGPLGHKGPDGGGDRITNEVWKSDDLGVTWQLLLPHVKVPQESGPNARFGPRHTFGLVVHNGHAVLIGNDPLDEQLDYTGDVWVESNNGATWTRVSTTAPTKNRTLFLCGSYKGAVYVMGGQASLQDPSTALNDVWRSTDGGLTWSQLANAPWSPRGIVYRPVEHDGKLLLVGGGRYGTDPYPSVAFNGVYAFDGTSWQTVLPDGHNQFVATYYNPVVSLNDRLWLFNGYDPMTDTELTRALYSDDDGKTWRTFADGPGGPESHADALTVASGRILRISGNLGERAVWEFLPLP